jgi:hypothetical protein
MDILVRLEARPADSPVLAHVNSIPVASDGARFGRPGRREVVTLYGEADPQHLALALAASVESGSLERSAVAVRHLGVWPDRGAVGDAAWRDDATGELQTRDLDIALPTLQARASELLGSCGPVLQRVVAGLITPDWPEGTERALSFTLRAASQLHTPHAAMAAIGGADGDEAEAASWLDALRTADGNPDEDEEARDAT